jgi:hypothetical protein
MWQITNLVSDWEKYFLKNAKKYTSEGNQGNMAYLIAFDNRHWMSAGDWLRFTHLLPFWHGISLEDVQRGSRDVPWLNHREENVCNLGYMTDVKY